MGDYSGSDRSGDGGGSGDSVIRLQNSSDLESQPKESMVTEWTDEKHSLYLKSMEASFVDQLYSTLDSASQRTQRDCSSDSISSRKTGTRVASGQFKVLKDGCWSKINFKREKLRLKNGSRVCNLPANVWIQHFRNRCCHENLAPSCSQENSASAFSSQHFPISDTSLLHQESAECDAECTDQNFADEEIARESSSDLFSRKRLKTSVVTGLSNDQIVPVRTFPLMATDMYPSSKE